MRLHHLRHTILRHAIAPTVVLTVVTVVVTVVASFGSGGAAVGLAAQEKQTFIGTITDDMCVGADHSAMRMGSNDEECARACADAHGAGWVLFDGKTAYVLSDQKTAATLAAKKVRVTGTLDPKTKKITVDTIRTEP